MLLTHIINSLHTVTTSRVMHAAGCCAKNFLTSLQHQARIGSALAESTSLRIASPGLVDLLLEVACQSDIAFSRHDNSSLAGEVQP